MRPFPLVLAALLLAWLVWRWRRRSNGQRIAGIIAVAALLVYGGGLVGFPNLETLIEDTGGTLGKWTYLLVGAMTFLETGAFLSFVAPGEFTILFGGLVAAQVGVGPMMQVIAVATLLLFWAATALAGPGLRRARATAPEAAAAPPRGS